MTSAEQNCRCWFLGYRSGELIRPASMPSLPGEVSHQKTKVSIAQESSRPKLTTSSITFQEFSGECYHDHSASCERCDALLGVFDEISRKLGEVDMTSDQRARMKFEYEKSERSLREWKAHLLRSIAQEGSWAIERLFDSIRKKWAATITGVTPHAQQSSDPDHHSIGSDSLGHLPLGWALKTVRKSVRMTEKFKAFLVRKFNAGATSGQKADPIQVSKDMKFAKDESGKSLFNADEWRTSSQVCKFLFAPLSSSEANRGTEGKGRWEGNCRTWWRGSLGIRSSYGGVESCCTFRHGVRHVPSHWSRRQKHLPASKSKQTWYPEVGRTQRYMPETSAESGRIADEEEFLHWAANCIFKSLPMCPKLIGTSVLPVWRVSDAFLQVRHHCRVTRNARNVTPEAGQWTLPSTAGCCWELVSLCCLKPNVGWQDKVDGITMCTHGYLRELQLACEIKKVEWPNQPLFLQIIS